MSVDLEDRLRAALAHRADQTEIGHFGDPLARSAGHSTDRTPHELDVAGAPSRPRIDRARAVVALGAAAALVATVVVVAQRRPPTSDERLPSATAITADTADTPDSIVAPADRAIGADVALTDPTALDLDGYRVLPATRPTPRTFTVLAIDALPAGWTARVTGAFTLIDLSQTTFPGTGGYKYDVAVVDGDGRSFQLTVTSEDFFAGAPVTTTGDLIDGSPVEVRTGASGEIGWRTPDGAHASLWSEGASVESLTEMAQSLPITTVDQLPDAVSDDAGVPATGEPQLGGTIAGRPWGASISPGPLRTMFVHVDGRLLGGFENDRLSQPDDVAIVGMGETTLGALPGVGAIAFGSAAASATGVIATLADGTTVSFPTFQRDLEAFWAVPIPTGVSVVTLSIVAGGEVVGELTVPPLDPQLGGAYGGVLG